MQPAIDQASSLYGVRIVVKDSEGDVIADSSGASSSHDADSTMHEEFNLPLLSSGRKVGTVALAPSIAPLDVPEAVRIDTRVCAESVAAVDGAGRRARRCPPGVAVVAPRPCPHEVAQLGGEPPGTGRPVPEGVDPGPGRDRRLGPHLQLDGPRTWSRPEQQRRSLMADVAHELRTPLSNIQGYLEAVRDGLMQPDNRDD